MEKEKTAILSLIRKEAKKGGIMLPKPNVSFVDETEFYYLNESKTQVSVLLSFGRTCVWAYFEKRGDVWLKVGQRSRYNQTGLGIYFTVKGSDYQTFYEEIN